jgi:hypothetical protein
MSYALKLVEDCDGVKTNEPEFNKLGYFKKILNTEFVDTFLNTMGSVQKLKEFVYAVDLLIEISESPLLPSGRLLNNCDVTTKAALTWAQQARYGRDRQLFGCQVSSQVAELIQEFFDYGYPKLLGELFTKTRFRFAAFTLHNVQYQLIFTREFNVLSEYAAIKLISNNTDIDVFIPFLQTRLA